MPIEVVDVDFQVDDGAGDSRQLSIDDFKTTRTGAATAAKQDELKQLVSDRLVASILTDPVVTASNAVRDRLPAALHADGGVKVHLVNPTTDPETGLAKDATSVEIRDNVATANTHLANIKTAVEAAATDAAVQTLLARVGPQVSGDTLLALLRDIKVNTGTPIADIASLELTAEQVQLNTDTLETLLGTLIGHVDGVEGNQATGNTTLSSILAKLIAAPATEAKQDALLALLPAALSSGRFKTEATPTSGSTWDIADRAGRVLGLVGSSIGGAPTTQTSVAATTTSADALAANGSATYRSIENNGIDDVTLKLGSGTVTDYQGIVLVAGGSWDGLVSGRLYQGLVRCKTFTGTATLSVIEG